MGLGKIKLSWKLIAILAGVLVLVGILLHDACAWRSVEKSEAALRVASGVAERASIEAAEVRGELTRQSAEKAKMIVAIRALEAQEPKVVIKPVEKLKTVTVEKIEYVPKVEYVTLEKSCQFSLAIREKYSEYLDFTLSVDENVARLVKTSQADAAAQKKVIEQLKIDKIKLEKFARRRWSLVAGGGVNHQGTFGPQITLGIRIL